MKALVPALAALVLAACSATRPTSAHAPAPAAGPTSVPAPPSGPHRVDGPAARQLVQSGARLLDVRTSEEYQAGHLAGALLVPYDQVAGRAAELGPPGEPVVVYCRSGRRSAIAASTLRAMGFTQVYDLGPMDAWDAPAASASR